MNIAINSVKQENYIKQYENFYVNFYVSNVINLISLIFKVCEAFSNLVQINNVIRLDIEN